MIYTEYFDVNIELFFFKVYSIPQIESMVSMKPIRFTDNKQSYYLPTNNFVQ